MKKFDFTRGLFVMIITCLTVLTGCTKEAFEEGDTPEPPTPPTPGEVVYYFRDSTLTRDYGYTYGLMTNKIVTKALVANTQDSKIIEINQDIPWTITHEEIGEMKRSKATFTLQDSFIGEKREVSSETNQGIEIKNYEQNFILDFDGFRLELFKKSKSAVYIDPNGRKHNLPSTDVDSVTVVEQPTQQKETVIDNDGHRYIRTINSMKLALHSTEHHTNETVVEYYVLPLSILDRQDIQPGEDILDGITPIDGSERLYWTSLYTYTAEMDAWYFYSESGKKQVHLKCVYDVRQDIQEEQPFKIVSSFNIGYPRLDFTDNVSEAYTKQAYPEYEFVKTSTVWNAQWSFGLSVKINTSSERAWHIKDGHKVAMPYSKHSYNYNKVVLGEETEKQHNGKTYVARRGPLYFDGSYNNDPYPLNVNQEFYVEKGTIDPNPGGDDEDKLIRTEILKELNNINGKEISKITFRQTFSKSGTRDSIATQEIEHWVKIEEKQRKISDHHGLTLVEMLEPVITSETESTDAETGHRLKKIVRKHTFTFDQIVSSLTSCYMEAYTIYRGEKVWFLTSVPNIALSGITPTDMGIITDNDKEYERVNYKIKFVETFNDVKTQYIPEADIDVEKGKTPDPEDEYVSHTIDKYVKDNVSYIVFHIKRSLSGVTDSIASQPLVHKVELEDKKHFIENTNEFVFKEMLDPSVSTQETVDAATGHHITTTETTYNHLFNLTLSKVKVTTNAAYTTYRGERIDFLSYTSSLAFAGLDSKDMGIVQDGSKEYNRTNYKIKYKETYNNAISEHFAEVDVDVEKKTVVVDRTKWEAINKKLEKYDDTHQKSSFTFHEEFSDGTQKNTYVEYLFEVKTVAPAKQTVKLPSANLQFKSVTKGTTKTTTREDGNIHITRNETPVTLSYEGIDDIFTLIDETGYYVNGDARVDFLASSFNTSNGGYTNPLQGEITENGKKYDRYNCVLTLNATYNNDSYNTDGLVDVDVEKNVEVTRTSWEARDKSRTYYNDRQQRLFFNLYEEFSDGTNKTTAIEKFVDAYGEAQGRQTIKHSTPDLVFNSLQSKTATSSNATDGNWRLTTYRTPYTVTMDALSADYWFTTTAATYQDGEITVTFDAPASTESYQGYSQVWEKKYTSGEDTYNRYDGDIAINIVNTGHTYSLVSEVYVDVIETVMPDTPDEWGKIRWDLTKRYGGASWTFEIKNNKLYAHETFAYITDNGVVNVTEGKAEFTQMNISRITSRVSAVINAGSGSNKYTAATVTVNKNNSSNPIWNYKGFDGVSNADVPGSAIVKLEEKIDVNEPFIFYPDSGDSSNCFTYASNGRFTIVYKGSVIHSVIFPVQ